MSAKNARNVVVIGTQWVTKAREDRRLLTDARQKAWCASRAGNNAGHTLVIAARTVLHLIPSGILPATSTASSATGGVSPAGAWSRRMEELEAAGVHGVVAACPSPRPAR